MRFRRLGRRARAQGGYSLVEVIAVMAMLLTVLTALTSLFASGARAELAANRRLQSQQEARLAVDRMRREIHCASSLVSTSAASVTVRLPSHCPTAGGTEVDVVYDTELVSADRYSLRRAGVKVADYLTSGSVFAYIEASSSSLGRLTVDVRVNVNPTQGGKTWRLTSDIVLRNTRRA